MAGRGLRFLRRGRLVEIEAFDPHTTILDWLRLEEGATGTKEGCAEGDCGACTVILARHHSGQLVYHPVNACIHLLGQLDGAELITIEDLAQGAMLHPVQEALVSHHASQCGFCTPGVVMSLFALYHQEGPVDRAKAQAALSGNLCRCTGYRPILDAAVSVCAGERLDRFTETEPVSLQVLAALDDEEDVFVGDAQRFFAAPRSEAMLSALIERFPEARLVAGATDVGLWITKELRILPQVIWLGRVRSLGQIVQGVDRLVLGASVPLAEAIPYLSRLDPDFESLMQRFGSEQIRHVGTIGGNLANASPVGDLAPALIAMGAVLELVKAGEARALPLQDFFKAYGQQDRQAGEYVRAVHIPRLSEGMHFRALKISKRFDDDISSVTGAFCVTLEHGLIAEARLAYGGMAGIAKRASHAEAFLKGQPIGSAATWKQAADRLTEDFSPLSDHRASAHYRMQAARGILIKALAEIAGLPAASTRIHPRMATDLEPQGGGPDV
jgi:xanthine dehydrogenase small subunit